MFLVSSFAVQLQGFSAALTRPSFRHWVTILTGWVLCGRRTITRMLVAAGVVGRKHHSIFHRFFAAANWSADVMGILLFRMIEPYLPDVCLLALDDTLAHKRGRKMYGVGMHHDPLLSGQGKIITAWGHNWIVLAVVVRFPIWPERVFSLPVLARLYVNKRTAAKWNTPYRTHGELALQMVRLLCGTFKNRRFHVVADSAYGGRGVAMFLYSLIVLWFVEHAAHHTSLTNLPWYRSKRLPSFRDMLVALRRESLEEMSPPPTSAPRTK